MIYFLSSFLAGLVATFVLLHASQYSTFSADHDLTGVQKFHARPVPRVGGIGVFVAIVAGVAAQHWALSSLSGDQLWVLLLCALPAFLAGIAEDVTKKVTPRWRLLATTVSGALAIWLLDGVIDRTHIPGVDLLIPWFPFAVALTLLVVAGVANSINIIDGFNGLASMCAFMMVLAIAYVAFQVGDTFVFTAALITAGAVLGFFVWNFPAGLIFLGDGGAYLLGFLLAELSILLMHRNPTVSPIFPLLLCGYPIFETMFTMYRRKFVRGVATGEPDGIHLHTLIHRRLIRWTVGSPRDRRRLTRRNSMTSPYLWVLCMMSVIPSVLWWNSTQVLSWFLLLFVISYVWIYSRIVRFRTPRWLVFRRHR
jgi:UDP-N-acetylmuramyl pentapeptide phosphotransferase/UDP-N-acetylglucosamine-1-phosphate transferase